MATKPIHLLTMASMLLFFIACESYGPRVGNELNDTTTYATEAPNTDTIISIPVDSAVADLDLATNTESPRPDIKPSKVVNEPDMALPPQSHEEPGIDKSNSHGSKSGNKSTSKPIKNDATTKIDTAVVAPIKDIADNKTGHIDTTILVTKDSSRTDSIASPQDLKRKSAVLGYSYISKMRRGEVKDINVYISASNPSSIVIDTLRTIVKEQSVLKTSDTLVAKYDTQNVSYYKYITLTLLDVDSAFEIKQIHSSNRQEIESSMDNTWRWTIKAITDNSKARLIIKGEAERPSKQVERLRDIDIPISIQIESPTKFFDKIYYYLLDNPAYLLSAILLPLATYFGKRYFDNKKAANS